MADAIAQYEASIDSARPLKDAPLRFGVLALKLVATDSCARSLDRVIVAAAGQSNLGELFFTAVPAQMFSRLAQLITLSMQRGELRPVDPELASQQFTAYLMSRSAVASTNKHPRR